MVGMVASMALPCVSSGTLVMSLDGVGCSQASLGSNDHPVVGVGVVGLEKSPMPEMASHGLLAKTEISISGSGSKRLIRGSRRATITRRQQSTTLSPCHVAAARGGCTVRWPPSSSSSHSNRQKKKRPGVHAAVQTTRSSCPRVFTPSSFDVIDKNSYPLLSPAKSGLVLVDSSLPILSSTASRLQPSRAFPPSEHWKDSTQSGFHRVAEWSAGKKTRGTTRLRAATVGKETTKDCRSDGERARDHKSIAQKKGALASSLCAAAELPRQGGRSAMPTKWRREDWVDESADWVGQEEGERVVAKPSVHNWINEGRLNNAERWVYSEESGGKEGIMGGGHVSLFFPLSWLPMTSSTSSASQGSAAIARVEEEEAEEEGEERAGYARAMENVSSSSSSSSSPSLPSHTTRYASRLSEIPLWPTSSGSGDLEQAYGASGRVLRRGGGGEGGGGGGAFALGLGRALRNNSQNKLTEAESEEEEEREEEREEEKQQEEKEEGLETEKVLQTTSLLLSTTSMLYVAEKLWRSYIYSEFSSAVQSSPPPRQKQESALKDDYYVNVGYAIRTLREELPCLFYKEMTWDIYRKDIVFSDPFNRFQGIENYKSIFWALRFHGRIFFRVLWVDVVRIWQPCDKVIMVRWTVRGVPRVPWESHGHFDGNSEYKLDENGKIYSHKVDNVIMSPKRKPRTVIELIRIAARASNPTPTYFFRRALELAANIVPYVQSFSWVRFYFALRGTLAVKGELPEAEA